MAKGLFSQMESNKIIDSRTSVQNFKPFIGPMDAELNAFCTMVEDITTAELQYKFGINRAQMPMWMLTTLCRTMFDTIVKCVTEKRDKHDPDLTYTFMDCFSVEAKLRKVTDAENGGVLNIKTYTGNAYKFNTIEETFGKLIKRKKDFPVGLVQEGGITNMEEYLNAFELDEKTVRETVNLAEKVRTIAFKEYGQLLSNNYMVIIMLKTYLDNLIGQLLIKAYNDLNKSIEEGTTKKLSYEIHFFDLIRPTIILDFNDDDPDNVRVEYSVFFRTDADIRMKNKNDLEWANSSASND